MWDQSHQDLLGEAESTVSAASAVGTDVLHDTGKFANKNLVGAIGQITAGPGYSQTFWVTEVIDANTLRVHVMTQYLTATNNPLVNEAGTWETALTTSSKYRLFFPGAVKKAAAGATGGIRGFSEVKVETADIGKYGWVVQGGPTYGLLDVSGTAPGTAGGVVAAAGGLIDGGAYGGTSPVVGFAPLGDLTGTIDQLIPVIADIRNSALSPANPDTVPVFNKYTIR